MISQDLAQTYRKVIEVRQNAEWSSFDETVEHSTCPVPVSPADQEQEDLPSPLQVSDEDSHSSPLVDSVATHMDAPNSPRGQPITTVPSDGNCDINDFDESIFATCRFSPSNMVASPFLSPSVPYALPNNSLTEGIHEHFQLFPHKSSLMANKFMITAVESRDANFHQAIALHAAFLDKPCSSPWETAGWRQLGGYYPPPNSLFVNTRPSLRDSFLASIFQTVDATSNSRPTQEGLFQEFAILDIESASMATLLPAISTQADSATTFGNNVYEHSLHHFFLYLIVNNFPGVNKTKRTAIMTLLRDRLDLRTRIFGGIQSYPAAIAKSMA